MDSRSERCRRVLNNEGAALSRNSHRGADVAWDSELMGRDDDGVTVDECLKRRDVHIEAIWFRRNVHNVPVREKCGLVDGLARVGGNQHTAPIDGLENRVECTATRCRQQDVPASRQLAQIVDEIRPASTPSLERERCPHKVGQSIVHLRPRDHVAASFEPDPPSSTRQARA